MYYEINVSLNGQHFFATAERSCQSAQQANKVYKELAAKFPESSGYQITIYRKEASFTVVHPSSLERA